MRLDFGATVRTSDGHDAGTVRGAVIDPRSREIDQFVVSTSRLLGRDVLLSRRGLEDAEHEAGAVRLRLTKAQLDQMPEHVAANYVPPPAGWSAPADYVAVPGEVFVWPATYADPARPAARPTATEDQTEPALMKGARARDRDLEDLGVVDEVRFDPGSGRIDSVVIRLGSAIRTMLGGGETVEVDGSEIDRVEEGALCLRARTSELRRSPRP